MCVCGPGGRLTVFSFFLSCSQETTEHHSLGTSFYKSLTGLEVKVNWVFCLFVN